MEAHPDKPGVVEILSGESSDLHRILVTIALCAIFAVAVVATEALFR